MKKFNQTRLYSNNMIWSKSKQKLNENATHAHFSHVSNLLKTTNLRENYLIFFQ